MDHRVPPHIQPIIPTPQLEGMLRPIVRIAPQDHALPNMPLFGVTIDNWWQKQP